MLAHLDEGWVEELEPFLCGVREVPEAERATVVDVAGDESGTRQEV